MKAIAPLPLSHTVAQPVRDYLDALAAAGFTGDMACDYATRLSLATDNSPFQQLPAAAIFPRSAADIEQAMRLLARPAFRTVCLAPRGGGTSTAGCSLTAGVVLDCSRHMNRIIALDREQAWVRVEPGVVLDQLNAWLADHGLMFAPNVAPSSRATLGGMANTDGCGKGSRVYGKTSDHVRAAELVLADGTRFTACPVDVDTLADLRAGHDIVARIHDEVVDVLADHADEIRRVFPDLARYLSGYNLDQIWNADHDRFNLNKLICGSEGTLAVVAELCLNVVPIPAARTLFALRYDSFDAALRDAQTLVAFEPSAIESLDDKVMGLARDNPIYERVRDYIENADGSTPRAVNLVEFAVAPGERLDARIADFADHLADRSTTGARGFYEAAQPEAQAALWDLRKSGVGLLGASPGPRKPLPFVEDTVVDPRVLADYVHDFRAVLDEYGLEYGMFGHIDVGCLHVRPALDLTDPDDERIMREVMDRVEALVRRYGGLVWNEHGKGFRSQYNPDYFGPVLYGALQRIKKVFDPGNQLNPGKIVVPADTTVALAAMDAPTRGTYDRQIAPAQRARFVAPLSCNGNGACFNQDPFDVMCPSYRATRDRLHSPKGRAGAMREWLRQLAGAGQHTLPAPESAPLGLLGSALADARPRAIAAAPDFSHEVWQAMDGCLSCKGCSGQCPVRVDVPEFKARFLAAYHADHPRPLGDYALAWLENGAARAARWPRLANALAARPAVAGWISHRLGLCDLPRLSEVSMHAWLKAHPRFVFSAEAFHALSARQRSHAVGVVPDAFTQFFDAETVQAVFELLETLGFIPLALPFRPSGKPLQVKGFLAEFETTARAMSAHLASFAAHGLPLVGIEPSVTQLYGDEYPRLLGRAAVPEVARLEVFLDRADLETRLAGRVFTAHTHRLLQHCTIASSGRASDQAWQRVFAAFNQTLSPVALGCCGMSGAYGHETRHRETSKQIYALSWGRLEDLSDVVVPGYSCRSQVARMAGRRVVHPATVLRDLLAQAHAVSDRPIGAAMG